jgi:hypothetical protein
MSAGLPLSAEALVILRDAKARNGGIFVMQADGAGKGIVVGAQNKFPEDRAAQRRNWDALQDLVAAGLVDKLSESSYELTTAGWEAAEEL